MESIIEIFEKAKSISELCNVKKLSGFKTYYSYRIGDFRRESEKRDENTVRLILVARRKDMYKIFP